MKRRLSLIFILSYWSLMACDCSPITSHNDFVQESYKKSDIVFLGKVNSIEKDTIVFSIIELFKGEVEQEIIKTYRNSCSIAPIEDEMWLIYLEKSEKREVFLTNMCLPNRNYGIVSALEEAPLPPSSENGEEDTYISFKRYKKTLEAIELNSLRQKKILDKIKNDKKNNILFIKYGIILIIFLLILNSILLFVKRR